MLKASKLIATLAVAGVVPTVAAQAADGVDAPHDRRAAKLEVLERPTQRLVRSIEVHRDQLQRERRRREAREPDFVAPEHYGVSQGTLDSIAACESGGDPTAVSADGTYRGKYQFDTGTWASVGGSGDPASAPEEEQDMRAAMLYSSAGTSPWPICGS